MRKSTLNPQYVKGFGKEKKNSSPFKLEMIENAKLYVHGDSGICYNEIFNALELTKETRLFLLVLFEFIDINTGIISMKTQSEPHAVPIGAKEIAVATGRNYLFVVKVMKELCFYGVVAEVNLANMVFYIVNPYFVTRGHTANSFLMSIFNKFTLSKFHEINADFSFSNKFVIKEYIEKAELIEKENKSNGK